ncbi:MAG: carboxypeptidase-like regulatory domain-containing protein [Bryobacteraceae bacterium]
MAKISFLALLLVELCSDIEAQVLYGSIVGNVNDSTESPVPGVLVIIKNKETGQSRETATNDAGGFIFPDVAAEPTMFESPSRASPRSSVPMCR